MIRLAARDLPQDPEQGSDRRLSAELLDRRADDLAQARALREWDSPEARCRRKDALRRFQRDVLFAVLGAAATQAFIVWVLRP